MMAIVLTNLETQVQDRIDSLAGSESLEDLLILSKSAEGLDVNRTQLDAAIETKLQSLNATSTLTDLLLSNKAAMPLSSLSGASDMKVVGRQIETLPASRPAGVILTATAVGDKQRLRIRVLGSRANSTEWGMTVSIDGFNYIDNGILGGLSTALSTEHLVVTPNPYSVSPAQNLPLLYNEIVCKTFTLTKVSGSTAQVITCTYDILEPLE